MPEPTLPPSRVPLPVVIDSDPGIDDCLALALALNSPELDVRGLSISYGNTTIENAWRNAVEIVRRFGRGSRRVTLGIGARRPLKRPLAVAADTHGRSGLGYAALPPAGVILDYVRPLVRLLGEQPEPVTLVTLGPVTSLALALRADRALVRAKVARHVAMIGSLEARGTQTKYSEFNAWCDPEALGEVLAAELPTEIVGLDVTRSLVLSAAEIDRIEGGEAAWLRDALRCYVEFHRKHERLEGAVVNDVLAIGFLLDPAVLSFRALRLAVELAEGDKRGQTRPDPRGALARVAVEARPEAVRRLLFDRVLNALQGAEAAV